MTINRLFKKFLSDCKFIGYHQSRVKGVFNMTKHIAGIMLFTFIVGTSAVIAGLFYETPREFKSFSVREDHRSYKRKKRKKRCRPHRGHYSEQRGLVSVGIAKAVFDATSGLLTASHTVEPSSYEKHRGTLVYHFYVKDEYGTRHVKSERVWGSLESSNLVSPSEWLQNRHSTENLYVASEYRRVNGTWRVAPKFEDSNAIKVLIKKEK